MSKILRKLGYVFILSSSLISTVMASDSSFDEINQSPSVHSLSSSLSLEQEYWWNNWEKARASDNNLMLAKYVYDLSQSYAKTDAATWFLTTGGKDGFAKRNYFLDGEENYIKSAIKNIADKVFLGESWDKTVKWYRDQHLTTYGYLSFIEDAVTQLRKERENAHSFFQSFSNPFAPRVNNNSNVDLHYLLPLDERVIQGLREYINQMENQRNN